jgi:small subunit ribosomal protein S20
MANTAQARKRARQSEKQRKHNASLRSALRTALKSIHKAIATGDKAAAQTAFRSSTAIVDRIADKKIIHKNKAARHKSRLAVRLKAMPG